MATKTRTELQNIFVTGYKPTETDYDHVFDSHLNLTDDADLLGLRAFDATRAYAAGLAVVYNGLVYVALVNVSAGAFNPSNWQALGAPNGQSSFAAYDPNETYAVDDFVEYGLRIWKSLQNGNLAQLPGSAPLWWVEVSQNRLTEIPAYATGAWPLGAMMEYDYRLWRATASHVAATTDPTADIQAGVWVEVRRYAGVPRRVESWDTLTIADGNQHVVHGVFEQLGVLVQEGDGELIVIS